MNDLMQYLFSGLSVGCIYAFVALALVVVANVTGVYNFALGEYIMAGGMIFSVTSTAGASLFVATLAAIGAVVAVAIVQERVTVAPVRGRVGPLGLVIASVGFSAVLRGAALLIWGDDPRPAQPYQSGIFHFLGASLTNQVKWVYLATAVSLVLVVLLFARTDVGRAMRACAINPMAARLTGIRTGTMSLAAFILAGLLCGLIAAVSAPLVVVRFDSGVSIGLVGFIAAALAGFTSPGRAVVAGLALGVVQNAAAGLISSKYRDAIVYGVLIVYLVVRDLSGESSYIRRAIKSRNSTAAGSVHSPELRQQVAGRVNAVEEHLRRRTLGAGDAKVSPVQRLLTQLRTGRFRWMSLLPIVLLVLAWFYPSTTDDVLVLDTAVFILIAAMAATGLSLVMGLAAQFSLGQAAFMLVSGYAAAILTADHGWDPLVAALVAIAMSAVIGAIVGWLTLRLEGLNLALATLAILTIAIVFVTQNDALTHGQAGVQNVPGLKLFGTYIEEPGSYFRFCLIVLAVFLLLARNIWRSRMGRTLQAIGIDEEAAASTGVNASSLKMRVFVLSAVMAGTAGVLSGYYSRFVSPDTFDVKLAIDLVTYVIVGGVLSPFGGVVGAVVVGVLQYYFRQHVSNDPTSSSTYEVLLSGGLLVFFVLVFRSGLAAIPQMLIDRAKLLMGRRAPTADVLPGELTEGQVSAVAATPDLRIDDDTGVERQLEPLRDETPVVVVEGLTRRFGNLIAVNGVSFTLRPGYVTALIGPNGAGKSTLISMISGTLIPTEGAVGVMGKPVVGLGPGEIASLGLARTFQTPRLFEGMTLLETVMLGRYRYGSRSWLFGGALRTPRARRDEREARDRALTWLAYVGLLEDADRVATELPVGKQRMAEVARALATEPAVLLLDEPAAGLDGAETRQMAQVIRSLADAGIAVLLVEHDMGMVMSIADHIVVLEEGKKLAEGTASVIGNDQKVVDAYLGVVHA